MGPWEVYHSAAQNHSGGHHPGGVRLLLSALPERALEVELPGRGGVPGRGGLLHLHGLVVPGGGPNAGGLGFSAGFSPSGLAGGSPARPAGGTGGGGPPPPTPTPPPPPMKTRSATAGTAGVVGVVSSSRRSSRATC